MIGRNPEAVYDILFKETDFSIFTRDTVDFYEDVLSGFLAAYVDGFREKGKRDDIEKKIRILETYVNNIPEDYVRNILEKRLFLCKRQIKHALKKHNISNKILLLLCFL